MSTLSRAPSCDGYAERGSVLCNYAQLSDWRSFEPVGNQFSGNMIQLTLDRLEEREAGMEISRQQIKEPYDQGV